MDKKQIIDLWQTCFNDSKAFVELYFDKVYREQNTLAYEENGKVVSALQMLPYSMTYGEKEIPVSYISGASTYPAAQGKGLMQKLMGQAFEEMKRRKILLSVLIPAEEWLFRFYHKTGYAEVMFYKELACPMKKELPSLSAPYTLQPAIRRIGTEEKIVFDTAFLYAYFNRKMKERKFAVQPTQEDFEIILQDLLLNGGQLFTASDISGKIHALAFVYLFEGNAVCIKELLADDEEIKQQVLNEVPSYYPAQTVWYKDYANSGIPYGMARVIDAETMLGMYASLHPDLSLNIDLKDCILPENTGYYEIGKGYCKRKDSFSPTSVVLPMDIVELPVFLFAGKPVYMTLMLD
ncbi:GNAT family N-acetyltransferase [Parabacteroides pacaensis]|uniref:GNAT family N-acetyltransferase n=1 Tax=Parabacteroides pacaensis TaxID=2086575 RepID=UPI000D0FC5AC|nr:GNAT family N-acetyltransferase [Parabacteroides pacaensis]